MSLETLWRWSQTTPIGHLVLVLVDGVLLWLFFKGCVYLYGHARRRHLHTLQYARDIGATAPGGAVVAYAALLASGSVMLFTGGLILQVLGLMFGEHHGFGWVSRFFQANGVAFMLYGVTVTRRLRALFNAAASQWTPEETEPDERGELS